MSGIEIVVLVGAGIYITKKVKENKAKKRLAREAALAAEHGTAQEIEPGTEITQHPRYSNRSPPQEEEALPLYRAPTGKPPGDDEDATDEQWSNEIKLPTYDELSGSPSNTRDEADAASMNTLSRSNSSHASSSTSSPITSPLPSTSSSPNHLSPETAAKKHRRFFHRSNRSKSELPQEL